MEQNLNKNSNNYNIYLTDTDTLSYQLMCYDKYGRAYDFTDFSAKMDIRDSRDRLIYSLSTDENTIILNNSGITGLIYLFKQDFNDAKQGQFKYDLRVIKDLDNSIYTIMYGNFIITKNITTV
jgi:hypothetical protein